MCKTHATCSTIVTATDSEILNYLYQSKYESISKSAMTVDQWKAASAEVDKLVEISKNKSSFEWQKIVDNYYNEDLTMRY